MKSGTIEWCEAVRCPEGDIDLFFEVRWWRDDENEATAMVVERCKQFIMYSKDGTVERNVTIVPDQLNQKLCAVFNHQMMTCPSTGRAIRDDVLLKLKEGDE